MTDMNKKWTEEEDELILSGTDLFTVANTLGRTYVACKDRHYRLRTTVVKRRTKRKNSWSKDEIVRLTRLTDEGYKTEDISALMGRSMNSIYTMRKKLKAIERTPDIIDKKPKLRKRLKLNGLGRDLNIHDPDLYWLKKLGYIGIAYREMYAERYPEQTKRLYGVTV